MIKRTILALAVAAMAYVGVAQAQGNVTFVLRSGERVSGTLLDYGGVGFTIKVNNEERRIPTNDVAIIDFAGANMTNEDWARVAAGQHIIWLRSGETVTGQFYDISGRDAANVTVKTDSGERTIRSSDISRIVLARTDAAAAAAPNTPAPAATTGTAAAAIMVKGNQQWTPTGLFVRQGETLTFNTTGEIRLGLGADDMAGPAGARSGRLAQGAPLPNSLAGALIARIGNGRPFGIGDQTTVPAPATGQLFLGVNDDNLSDNVGEFRVEVSTSGRRIRR